MLRQWMKSSFQAATVLGLAMILLIWTSIAFLLGDEHDRVRATVFKDTSNLARVFEEHIIRALSDVDKTVMVLRSAYLVDPDNFDLAAWFANSHVNTNLIAQMGVIGPDGTLRASSIGPLREPIDLSDREHFRVHLQTHLDELFISKPLLGRASGRWSILLSRAARAPDGKLLGVLVGSLDPAQLARLYESIDLGPNGAIVLVGLDGIVRASAGYRQDVTGRSMAAATLLGEIARSDAGSYRTRGIQDGIPRLASYRVIRGFPLAVLVGRSEQEVFANYWRTRNAYHAVAVGLTLLILVVMAIAIRHRMRLDTAREALQASEAHAHRMSHELKVTLEHTSQGIMMVDADNRIAVVNERAVELLGLPDSVYSRPKFAEIMNFHMAHEEYGKEGENVDQQLWDAVKAGKPSDINCYERTRPNGTVLEVRTNKLPEGGVVRTFTDISDRKRNEAQISRMARQDHLTGLANRALLQERLEHALARLRRYGEAFALLCLDLDRFKAVNDSLGHAAGDSLLKTVGQRLSGCVRETDTVARLGGDEFAILLTAMAGRDDAVMLANRIIEVIKQPFDVEGNEILIGTSIGIAVAPDDGLDLDLLRRRADLVLYQVKSEGRNGYRFFTEELEADAEARRVLQRDLHLGFERNEFHLRYQPIVNLATGAVTAIEALVRWNHPERGIISPAEFIPIAEETGLIVPLGEWILRRACADAALWPRPVAVAVNLSPTQFEKSPLVDVVSTALAAAGLPASRLELEITESVILQENMRNLAILHELRELGVAIALDDFGTGYSSLSYLRAFQFDKIKIDRSFVSELANRPDCVAIVGAVAGLGRSLGVTTTAEGVETQTQLELLRAAGCTEAQGYFFSHPRLASEVADLLLTWRKRFEKVA